MKRIIICSDGTMNTAFQTTRGRDQDFKPFSITAFKKTFWVWILGCFVGAGYGYYMIPLQVSIALKAIGVVIILLITLWFAYNKYLQKLREGFKDKTLRKKLLWDYIVKNGSRTPSHVTKISRAVKPISNEKDKNGKEIKIPQIVFYDKGIGTGGISDTIFGGIFGLGFKNKVLTCYNFIAENYEEGDEVYLFGFSRGAFTVRVLSALIAECGLLTKADVYYAPEAYELFKLQAVEGREKLIKDFREGYSEKEKKPIYARRNEPCRSVQIHFLGVWDTVPAFGLLGFLGRTGGKLGRHLRMNNFTLSKNVKYAYHALGLDEDRRAFDPLLWNSPPKYEVRNKKKHINKVMEQRWFIGVHTTIGGGFERDELSYITFDWMINNTKKCGLKFNKEKFEDRKDEKKKTYIEFFTPNPDTYKAPKKSNSRWMPPIVWFRKKRIVRLHSKKRKESVDNSVYLRMDDPDCKSYKNRKRWEAEIPPRD